MAGIPSPLLFALMVLSAQLRLGGFYARVAILDDLDIQYEMAGFAAVISGHTQRPPTETRPEALYINPVEPARGARALETSRFGTLVAQASGMEPKPHHHGSYLRFFAMIATSMVAMFFLMYLNSYQILDHAWFSETRLFMTLIMGAAMIAVMLGSMHGMYENRRANVAIFAFAGLLLLTAVWLVRSQATVSGVDYMRGMIPHHSIAILTSERARIEDPRVRELADKIIEAQRREIREMKWLISDIRTHGVATTRAEAEARSVPEFSAAPE